MRDIELSPGEPLKLSLDARQRLKDYLDTSHKKAISNRYGIEDIWRRCIRAYEGNLSNGTGWRPFADAPRIEITLGASICDAIQSQLEDLIFSLQPAVTARSKHKNYDLATEAMQDLINWGTAPQGPWNFEPAVKEGFINAIQLGTEVLHIPFTQRTIKTDLRRVRTFRPKVICIDPNDFIIPENAMGDIQDMQWCTYRMHLTPKQVLARAKRGDWWLDDTQASDQNSLVRNARLHASGVTEGADADNKADVHIGLTFLYFDVDDDGEEEDLQIIWNMSSGGILKASYNPYDCRPFVMKPYQQRAHIPHGLGVMQMTMPHQIEDTELHNNFVWNQMLANTKMYSVPTTLMDEDVTIYPGKVWSTGPGEKIEAIEMGAVSTATLQTEAVVTGMARERTGATSLAAPVKSSSRTPASSMASMMQQANRRFTHPFNNMRNGVAEAVIQCVYRIQERVKQGDASVKKQLKKILGEDKAAALIDYFKSPTMEILDGMDIQVQASTVAVNKEADRQNWIALATQVFPMYWNAIQQLVGFIAHPPFPGADKVAQDAYKVLNTFWEKILKSFDQVSDPTALQIDIEAVKPMMQQLGLEHVPGQLNGALTALSGQSPQGPPVGGGAPLPAQAPPPGQP